MSIVEKFLDIRKFFYKYKESPPGLREGKSRELDTELARLTSQRKTQQMGFDSCEVFELLCKSSASCGRTFINAGNQRLIWNF